MFPVDDEKDHAETPFEAYRDLEPLLYRLAVLLGRTKATLRVSEGVVVGVDPCRL